MELKNAEFDADFEFVYKFAKQIMRSEWKMDEKMEFITFITL
jgi:hypothetical protein